MFERWCSSVVTCLNIQAVDIESESIQVSVEVRDIIDSLQTRSNITYHQEKILPMQHTLKHETTTQDTSNLIVSPSTHSISKT